MFYSAHDLFNDIMKENVREFKYNNETFTVSFDKGSLIVHWNGLTARNRKWNNEGMLDLQGLAACLLEEKRNLWFDQEGNLCEESKYDPTKRPRHKILEEITLRNQIANNRYKK